MRPSDKDKLCWCVASVACCGMLAGGLLAWGKYRFRSLADAPVFSWRLEGGTNSLQARLPPGRYRCKVVATSDAMAELEPEAVTVGAGEWMEVRLDEVTGGRIQGRRTEFEVADHRQTLVQMNIAAKRGYWLHCFLDR